MKTFTKNILIIAVLLLFGFSLSAQDSCYYEIGYYQDPNSNPLEVSYYVSGPLDSSTMITWNFGDGNQGYGLYTNHVYQNFGTYTVTADFYTQLCGQKTLTATITIDSTISPDCYVDFWYDVDENLTGSFYAYGSGYDSLDNWTWTLGDSNFYYGSFFQYQFPQEGLYYVTLWADNAQCGFNSVTHEVYIGNTNPSDCDAYFWYFVDSVNLNTVYFYNENYSQDSMTTYFWDFGDGSTSYDPNPVHTYIEEGQYSVSLTVSNSICTSIYYDWVWVGSNIWYPEECQALFYADYMNGLTVNFVDLSWEGNTPVENWLWSFGDSTFSNEQNPVHTYTSEGEYVVTLTILTENCSSTFEEIIYVSENPFGGQCQAFFYPQFGSDLTVEFFDMSMPTPNTWDWSFGDGTTSNLQNPVYTYSDTGVYTVTLSINSIDSCSSSFAMDIYLFEDSIAKSTVYSGKILRAYALPYSPNKIDNVKYSKISIYPNPVTDFLNVSFEDTKENISVKIINLSGQIIFSDEFLNTNNFQINTEKLSSGVYILQVLKNGSTETIKFVK